MKLILQHQQLQLPSLAKEGPGVVGPGTAETPLFVKKKNFQNINKPTITLLLIPTRERHKQHRQQLLGSYLAFLLLEQQ